MRSGVRRKSIVFIALAVLGVGGAVALNIGWVIFSWREAGLLIAGLILFPLIITGVVLAFFLMGRATMDALGMVLCMPAIMAMWAFMSASIMSH